MTTGTRRATLATFKQIKQAFEHICPLQEYLDRKVLNDVVAESLRRDHHSAEVAKLQLDRQVEQTFLVLLVKPDKWKLAWLL